MNYLTTVQPNVLNKVPYLHELRKDGLADTYKDEDGVLYLEPKVHHDFNFSSRLIEDKMSLAQIVKVNNQMKYISYDQALDLLPLPAIINSSLHAEGGLGDIENVVSLTKELLAKMKERYGVLPQLKGPDSIAFDRNTGIIELLAPFEVSAEQPDEVLNQVYNETVDNLGLQDDAVILKTCFENAIARTGTVQG